MQSRVDLKIYNKNFIKANKLAVQKNALAAGFFCISIMPAYFSKLLGGDSIRAGLTASIIIFFILALPFRIRYITPVKIILINAVLLLSVLFLYLISTLIYIDSDHTRFLFSLALLYLILCASFAFIPTLDLLKEDFFHKIILFEFYILFILGYLKILLKYFFEQENKSIIIFTEASHYAIVFLPFLFYTMYTCKRKAYAYLIFAASVVLALVIKSMTMIAGCILIIYLCYGRKLFYFISILIAVAVGIYIIDLEYFLDRINFSMQSRNISVLVFLSGWERAYLSLVDSGGIGLGFQQLGIVGPEGDLQNNIRSINNNIALNINDGGTLGSKIISELGVMGLLLIISYFYLFIKISKLFMMRKINGAKITFFSCIIIMFSIELFVRGMGYFSLLSFMFISSLLYFFKSREMH